MAQGLIVSVKRTRGVQLPSRLCSRSVKTATLDNINSDEGSAAGSG